MTLNVFQKVSGALLAAVLGSAAQAQVPDVPAGVSGTYTLTYAFAQSGSPFTNGTVKTFVLNGAADTLCVDGVSLGTGYRVSGNNSEIFWNGGNNIYYAMSLTGSGALNEFNVSSPNETTWKGQFQGAAPTSTSTTCGSGSTTPTLTTEQQAALNLAAGLYPDLFNTAGAVKSASGYTYLTYASGVSVGFKDGALYVSGGPFGSAITNRGTVSQVTAYLQNLKNSVNVTATTDMTNLFTLAAQAYPTIFSGTGTSFTTSADGYAYRYYANTGIYAAIKNGTVYLKGGSFGSTYTSVGALNAVLTSLNTKINGGSVNIPQGNYNLVVSGTYSMSGPISISVPFSYTISGIPAPSVADVNAIKGAFQTSLGGAGVTIGNFSFNVVENAASRVEFSVSATATVSGVTSTYLLNYVYSK